jgi:hypothetical protein
VTTAGVDTTGPSACCCGERLEMDAKEVVKGLEVEVSARTPCHDRG